MLASKACQGAERGVSGRTHLLSAQTYQALVDIIVFRFLFNKEHQHFSLSVKLRERLRVVGPTAGMQTLRLGALGPRPARSRG